MLTNSSFKGALTSRGRAVVFQNNKKIELTIAEGAGRFSELGNRRKADFWGILWI